MIPVGILHQDFGSRVDPVQQRHHSAGAGTEVHSEDGDSYVFMTFANRWAVVFRCVYMLQYRTREEAREVVRAYKENPGLADVALVLLA